jgi:hypothetical protein
MIKSGHLLKGAILTIISFSIISSAFAEDDTVGTYNIGVAAGFVTGYGLSYRQWFQRNGVQVTLTPWYYKTPTTKDVNLSLGLTGLHIFNQAKYLNLIGYASVHYWYVHSEDQYTSYPYDPYVNNPAPTTVYEQSTHKKMFVGGGPGVDIHVWKVSCNLMGGVAFQSDFDQTAGVTLTGDLAFYYSF